MERPMTDRISLTAAELAFLLSVSDGAAGSPVHRLLGFTDADRTDAVVAAGLGSLLLRHLAAPAHGQQVELGPAVTAVAEGLSRPRVCVQVGLMADRLADGALLFEAGSVRFILAPRAYRCYDVTGIDPTVDRRDPLLRLARAFLEQYRPAVASFTVLGVDPRLGPVTVAATDDGSWRFAAGREERRGLAADDALSRLHDELGALVQADALI
jgi:hypothetical protein